MSDFNCPNCGASLSTRLSSSKMVDCAQCETTVLLADDAMRSLGARGSMVDHASLVRLHQPLVIAGAAFHPMGHARFSYGRGWWDEYWCDTPYGPRWLSVDEGDYAIEEPMDLPAGFDGTGLRIGAEVMLAGERFLITEVGNGTCEGVRGEFPDAIRPGERYLYWHLTGPNGRLVTIEEQDGEIEAHEGHWVDPFEIEVKHLG